ncbi:MAG: N-acetylmuramoyl-L-alanine amidase [Bacteroidales bacterium]|nr:N-acetylmuramoyl-L-alanine amidase [Bacteroidales bacterium]
MEIKDHLLQGTKVKFKKTPNHSGEFAKNNLDTVVVHYTAGPYAPALATLINPRVKASAHLIVDRDGSVTQLAPFNIITWHAGKSQWDGKVGLNKHSIGIEIVNSGHLTKSGKVYRAWFGASYEEKDVMQGTHRNETIKRYWHTYTQEQIEAVTEICQLLIDSYGISDIVGHEEIAPKRKTDPGPAFPLDRMRNKLLKGDRDEDGGFEDLKKGRVLANSLNIRELPNSSGVKVARSLPKNKKVKIIAERNGWYKVSTEIEGWVSAKYIGLD